MRKLFQRDDVKVTCTFSVKVSCVFFRDAPTHRHISTHGLKVVMMTLEKHLCMALW